MGLRTLHALWGPSLPQQTLTVPSSSSPGCSSCERLGMTPEAPHLPTIMPFRRSPSVHASTQHLCPGCLLGPLLPGWLPAHSSIPSRAPFPEASIHAEPPGNTGTCLHLERPQQSCRLKPQQPGPQWCPQCPEGIWGTVGTWAEQVGSLWPFPLPVPAGMAWHFCCLAFLAPSQPYLALEWQGCKGLWGQRLPVGASQ